MLVPDYVINHGIMKGSDLQRLLRRTKVLCGGKGRGIEWSIQNDASRKISAESRNLGIQNKSLGISGSLHVEPSRSLEFL